MSTQAALLLTYFLSLTSTAYSQSHPHARLHPKAVSPTAKAGLAWPGGPYDDMKQYTTTGKVQWYYTWSPSGFRSDLEFVPMFWGDRQADDWSHNIDHTISTFGVTHVLGFNEPQEWTQSNMTPAHGADLWKQHIEPLKQRGIYLGSPAPSSAPSGKQWLFDWLGNCQGGCTVDFIALHWYDINSTAFIEYLEDFHNTFQRPIWVTEWACQNFNNAHAQCSQQDIVDFMNATQQFMDTTDWVERYAWFGAFRDLQGVNQDDALMDPSGHITPLGQQYIGATVPNVSSDYQPGVVHGGDGSTGRPSSVGSSALARVSVPFAFAFPAVVLWLALLHIVV